MSASLICKCLAIWDKNKQANKKKTKENKKTEADNTEVIRCGLGDSLGRVNMALTSVLYPGGALLQKRISTSQGSWHKKDLVTY